MGRNTVETLALSSFNWTFFMKSRDIYLGHTKIRNNTRMNNILFIQCLLANKVIQLCDLMFLYNSKQVKSSHFTL